MARVVHKFPVEAGHQFSDVPMPFGAEILHADVQGDQVYVWALVDPATTAVTNRRLGYVGTGHPAPEGAKHIGTCVERHWGLVFHIFEAAAV